MTFYDIVRTRLSFEQISYIVFLTSLSMFLLACGKELLFKAIVTSSL